jgi:hypothetical protein
MFKASGVRTGFELGPSRVLSSITNHWNAMSVPKLMYASMSYGSHVADSAQKFTDLIKQIKTV